MSKKDRTGNRKTREQKIKCKIPELGYYLIITDTEATERTEAHCSTVRTTLCLRSVFSSPE